MTFMAFRDTFGTTVNLDQVSFFYKGMGTVSDKFMIWVGIAGRDSTLHLEYELEKTRGEDLSQLSSIVSHNLNSKGIQ